jgi:gamma-butyrobetaine dioxygenase
VNCDCATCRDPSSGQRLVDLAELPVDTTIREVAESADTVDQRIGFTLLTATPTDDQTVAQIAETFSYVRETNYGRVFDVRAKTDANHLADTSRAIAPHTDTPYRDPVPTAQLLQCLTGAADGGESGLLDGFQAASLLRRLDPDAFDVLTSTLVTFRREEPDRPIIDVDPDGHIREVRFNHRAMDMPLLSPIQTRVFHAAYRRFASIIARPTLQVWFRLEPGDCLIVDNTRILHARGPATDGGPVARHLQGCYADLDGLASTLTTLEEGP